MKHIHITIEGRTALLCNKFTDEAALRATEGVSSSITTSNGSSPREIAESRLYRAGDDDSKLIIPGPNVFRSIIDGGAFHKIGKSKVTTLKSSIIPAAVEMLDLEIPIEHKDPWEVDSRAIRNPATGGRRLCYRPQFNDWRLSFEVRLDDSLIDAKTFRAIVDDAGKRIGLGDFRPSCKGPFGKYYVTRWEVSACE